ncbi:hypothetical protein QYE76_035837 [Lolium multiflorum]|uniref:RNase H type-1 domain-containing protein n=1 Tax=Lolium multiflorum TaxID=4521 RepID=A0AAD8R3E4_LOLMU|nr:hypothetical protein QYE76_035837 [Lolium multiflorum]
MASFLQANSGFSAISGSPCSMACRPRSGNAQAQPRSPPPGVTLVRWTPPRFGWTKLNFDGSVLHDGSGRASIGGVIRDANGRVVLSFAERTEHAPIGIVEARALIRGLKLALDYGCDRLVVEGDDLTLVKLLRCESTQTRIPREMLDEIIWLLDSCDVCEVPLHHVIELGAILLVALVKVRLIVVN